jgi:stage II sporulation protein D
LLLAGAASSLLAAGRGAVHGGTTTTAATATIVTNPAPVVLAVSGHGWGHGLGLSQWGAYGYAKHGWTYDRILAHYYSGTTLGPAPVATVRVLLGQGKKMTLESAAPWTVADAAGTKVTLDPGTMTLGPKLAMRDRQALQPPYTFTGKQPLLLGGKQYRGRLVVSSDGKKVQVVDVVALENYLKGVVPAEMPSGWPAEALKAQAVAARTYALANLHKGQGFDLYADTRDQVYGGVAAESTAASAAITATKGEVVLWNGKLADTLFFSTSGGRTASALDATGTAVPYLVSVTDPYDTLSPYHDWGPVLVDGAVAAKKLKLPPPISGLSIETGPSGRAKSVTATGADDTQATVTGAQFRALLGLRSTWFSDVLFSLAPAAKTITYGGAASLTGFARGADSVSLEAKAAGAGGRPRATSSSAPTARSPRSSSRRSGRSTASPGRRPAQAWPVSPSPRKSMRCRPRPAYPAPSGRSWPARPCSSSSKTVLHGRRCRRPRPMPPARSPSPGRSSPAPIACGARRVTGSSPGSLRRSRFREAHRLPGARGGRARRSGGRARLRQHRAARGEPVVPERGRGLVVLGDAASAHPGPGRGDRLRHRRQPSGPEGSRRRGEVVRRRLAVSRLRRARDVRRG